MNEARSERVRELIRSLEAVQLRKQALCEEDTALEAPSSSAADTGAAKIRKMQRIPGAKTGTTSKAPSII